MSEPVMIARCPKHGLSGARRSCFVCGRQVEQVPMVPAPSPGNVGEVPAWVLVSAFRYALGRQSYIVADTIDLLRAHAGVLRERGWDRLVVGEIREEVRAGLAGAEWDARAWMSLADVLDAFAVEPGEPARGSAAAIRLRHPDGTGARIELPGPAGTVCEAGAALAGLGFEWERDWIGDAS